MILSRFIANWPDAIWQHLRPTHLIKSVKDNLRLILDNLGVLDSCGATSIHGSVGGLLVPLTFKSSNIVCGEDISGEFNYPDGYGFAITEAPADVVMIGCDSSSDRVAIRDVDFIERDKILYFIDDPRDYMTQGIGADNTEIFSCVASLTKAYKQRYQDMSNICKGCSDNFITKTYTKNRISCTLTGGVSATCLALPGHYSTTIPIESPDSWVEGDYNCVVDGNEATVIRFPANMDRLLFNYCGRYFWLINENNQALLLGDIPEELSGINTQYTTYTQAIKQLRDLGLLSIKARHTIVSDDIDLITEITPRACGIAHYQELDIRTGDDIPTLNHRSGAEDVTSVCLVYGDINKRHTIPTYPGVRYCDIVDALSDPNKLCGAAEGVLIADRFIVDGSSYIIRPPRVGDDILGAYLCCGRIYDPSCCILKYIPIHGHRISIGCCISVDVNYVN